MNSQPVDILLVEDNPYDAELALHALKRHNISNHIHLARDGVEALEFIKNAGLEEGTGYSLPRIILLDIKLPRMDGLEVLRNIKADDRLKNIPIIMLTSSREDKDIDRCYELGVNSYVVKPVDYVTFSDFIKQMGVYWLKLNEYPTR